MRVRMWAAVLLSVAVLIRVGPPTAAAGNAIQIENAKPGSTEWRITLQGYASGAVDGYASLTSVNRGGQIALFVNTPESSYTMDIFRVGYYGGAGGRRMMPTIQRTGFVQPACASEPSTGLVECQWTNPYILTIPNSADPTDWMSGSYLVKLTAGTSRKQQYIIFTVRDDARASDLIMMQPVNTYQAYNVFGGKSLYGTIANRSDTANAAHKVSFDRPYYSNENDGAADFVDYQGMVRWLEREGYDVSYATNVDVDRDPNLLLNHKAFLSVGHDEYWTWRMRDHVEHARDVGVSLGFFCGNSSYWQVRYEPGTTSGREARTMVGYKEAWPQDPITPDYLKTNEFRNAPVNRPEDAMMGVMFITQARPVMAIEDASHWVFTGTGLRNGDRLANPDGTPFLGYEIDSMGPGSPAGVQRLAHSPVTSRGANFSDMTVYRVPSGATVFATGSISWSYTIPQIQQITRNVLARFINGAFAETTPVRPPLPAPFHAADIGDVGRPGFVALAGTDSFTLNGAGSPPVAGNDALYYAYQSLSGNGEITARMTGLQLYWDNRAGLMVRESLSPRAKYVSLFGRPSETRGILREGAELRTKDVVGASSRLVAAADLNLPNWLRLTRAGDRFDARISSDGVAWTLIGSATVPMTQTVYIGIAVVSSRRGVWATASFDNVSVTGGAAPPCAFSLSPVTASVPATVTRGTVTLTASGASCAWNAASSSGFLTVTSPRTGTGTATLAWEVTGNRIAFQRSGTITVAGQTFTVTQAASPTGHPVPNDFDRDGVTDLGVFRPSLGRWLFAGQPTVDWGAAGDMPVPGDYDGDGRPDVAVFRPATGTWYITGRPSIVWGAPGDIPEPADYDGDRITDIAVFRPSTGIFYVRNGASIAWGTAGDMPVVGDYNGDGVDDIAVYRPGTGTWYIRNGPTVVFGLGADLPVPADYNGDGLIDIAVFRPSTGAWIIKDQSTQLWGRPGDVPVPLDRNGDGIAELGVFRRATGTWYFKTPATDASETLVFGSTGDIPLNRAMPPLETRFGDYDGDWKADLTVFRPSTGDWVSLRSLSDMTDYTVRTWGLSGDIPVGRDYDGDGKFDPAVYRPSSGRWLVLLSSTNFTSYVSRDWGLSGDIPVPGDYDGDGRADFAVFRPSTGRWVILLSSTGNAEYASHDWGANGDVPVPADYDGDRRTDLAVFRPSNGRWYVLNRVTGAVTMRDWGVSGDVPVGADLDGDGKADIAVFRPSIGRWFITSSVDGTSQVLDWGLSGDIVAPADYDGDGKADVAVFRPSTGVWYVWGRFNRSWGLSGDVPALKNP
jgi:hypothetical protein